MVISAGILRDALAIAAWMSWAAASMFRLRLNCTVIRPMPSPLTEVIESTPAMAANSRSSGVAIEAAMVEGLAPGRLGRYRNRRKVDLRERRQRQKGVADDSHKADRHGQQRRHDRALDAESGKRHRLAFRNRSRGWFERGRCRLLHGDARSVAQPKLAVDHDPLTGLQSPPRSPSRSLTVRSTRTSRISTVESGWITNT